MTDAEVSLTNGMFDSMGSDPKHFNIAVPIAFMRALKECNMKVLEPICKYSLVVPKESVSIILQNLSSKNAIYQIESELLGSTTIEGEAPIKSMLTFPLEVSKTTSGRGIFSSVINKYEISSDQNIENEFIGPDPRNEVMFVINNMNSSLDSLDPIMSKKKKPSRSKFKRVQQENQIRLEKKNSSSVEER